MHIYKYIYTKITKIQRHANRCKKLTNTYIKNTDTNTGAHTNAYKQA